MNGSEFRAIRERLGLGPAEFAAELGYTGKGKNRVKVIEDFEADRKRIPLYIARLAWLIGHCGSLEAVPTTFRQHNGVGVFDIEWPDWPGYTREELDDER